MHGQNQLKNNQNCTPASIPRIQSTLLSKSCLNYSEVEGCQHTHRPSFPTKPIINCEDKPHDFNVKPNATYSEHCNLKLLNTGKHKEVHHGSSSAWFY